MPHTISHPPLKPLVMFSHEKAQGAQIVLQHVVQALPILEAHTGNCVTPCITQGNNNELG